MEFQLKLDIPAYKPAIKHTDKIMLIGSCFTEHISKRLEDAKFKVLSNPHGILFNPLSVCKSLDAYISGKEYSENDLFYLNETWNAWDFHTRFSETDASEALKRMNQSVHDASEFIREADWLIITLGSSYQYFLKETDNPDNSVANCHRAPGQWFEKRLLSIATITEALNKTIDNIRSVNPSMRIILTISPVRHIRDGVVNNNRSKARLIESVQEIAEHSDYCAYFPAYELVIDILRDYRFYDVDMVHPNYPATQFVWEHFSKAYFEEETNHLIRQITDIHIARNHKPRFPDTDAHRKFVSGYIDKINALAKEYTYLDFFDDIKYFGE